MKKLLLNISLVLVVLFLITGCLTKTPSTVSAGDSSNSGNTATSPADEAPIAGAPGQGFAVIVPNEATNPVITYNGMSNE